MLSFTFSFAQKEKIKLKNVAFKPGEINEFVYQIPDGIIVPENSLVSFLISDSKKASSKNKFVPLLKKGIDYEFSIKIPDSTYCSYMTIVDSKNKIVDNNFEKGYVVYMNPKTKTEIEEAKLSELSLIYAANYFLKVISKNSIF